MYSVINRGRSQVLIVTLFLFATILAVSWGTISAQTSDPENGMSQAQR
jgi:hypothetical protein